MSIFKIKISPIIKERDWEIKKVKAGRKEKNCTGCGRMIQIGDPGITFVKRRSTADKQSYHTQYAHPGNCARMVATAIGSFTYDEIQAVAKM